MTSNLEPTHPFNFRCVTVSLELRSANTPSSPKSSSFFQVALSTPGGSEHLFSAASLFAETIMVLALSAALIRLRFELVKC